MTPDEIIFMTSSFKKSTRYDGAMPYDGSCIPYNFLKLDQILNYLKIWNESEDEINSEMRDAIEENCPENPEKNYVSKNWLPFAYFNGGSHIFVRINEGKYSGIILGIFDGPYSVIKAASNIEEFLKLGSNSLHLLK